MAYRLFQVLISGLTSISFLASCATVNSLNQPKYNALTEDSVLYIDKLETHIDIYVKTGVDLSSAGLYAICHEGKESCLSNQQHINDRCIDACSKYRGSK